MARRLGAFRQEIGGNRAVSRAVEEGREEARPPSVANSSNASIIHDPIEWHAGWVTLPHQRVLEARALLVCHRRRAFEKGKPFRAHPGVDGSITRHPYRLGAGAWHSSLQMELVRPAGVAPASGPWQRPILLLNDDREGVFRTEEEGVNGGDACFLSRLLKAKCGRLDCLPAQICAGRRCQKKNEHLARPLGLAPAGFYSGCFGVSGTPP